jgi:hypothetical protein
MDSVPVTIAPVIPAAHKEPFIGSIVHPDLWLWDSWCYQDHGLTHLHCLALGRKTPHGNYIRPADRNQYPFHIRHFTSTDDGKTWVDLGVFQTPCPNEQSFYSRNVWSGCVKPVSDTQKLVSFTGIRSLDPEHEFLQAIGLAQSDDGASITRIQNEALSCPRRDYDAIINAGYYLGPKDGLGANAGEEDGPIMAWRDPFIFVDENDEIQLFWSAKTAPKEGAIAHACLKAVKNGFAIKELHPPMRLPDGQSITQAEVPNIIYNKQDREYYLLISACDRLHEQQADHQVSKTLRLYKSKALRGPWAPYRQSGSILTGLEHCFGASILDADFKNGRLRLACPLTERAAPDTQLSFAPVQTIIIRG